MKYNYVPVYKYLIFFILLFLFIYHCKIISKSKITYISIIGMILILLLDYIFISKLPPLISFENEINKKQNMEKEIENDFDNLFHIIKNNNKYNKHNRIKNKINKNKYVYYTPYKNINDYNSI